MGFKKVTKASAKQSRFDWIGTLPILAWVLLLIHLVCITLIRFVKIPFLSNIAVILTIGLSFLDVLIAVFGFFAIISQFLSKKKNPQKIWIELAIFLSAFVVI
jgi:hypothetical protein